MKTNQKIVSLLTASVLGLSVLSAKAVPSVSLEVQNPPITVGQTFDVLVMVYDNDTVGEELVGFAFDVDPGGTLPPLLTYNGFTLGPVWDPPIPPSSVVEGLALPGTTDPDVLLATLSFTANAQGTSNLRIFGDSTYFDGLVYEIQGFDISRNIDIVIGGAQGVPDSGSLWMTALTLLGLCGLSLRCRKQLQ